VKTYPQFRDAHEAHVAAVDTFVAACAAPYKKASNEDDETAIRIAKFTLELCAKEVL
jgi:hypothetical protein